MDKKINQGKLKSLYRQHKREGMFPIHSFERFKKLVEQNPDLLEKYKLYFKVK